MSEQFLADFLNHGILPFVGRDAERDRIVAFWRGTFEATELRAMLMLGEAGIGKSRLLDEAMRRVVDASGCVVHVKLYPEAAVGLIELTARALWHPNAGRTLLPEEPEATAAAVAAALQRLARLRPTLLVVEDLHLLSADAVGELARLLRQIADETISLLALARPVELAARGVLEQYLVDDVVVDGLSQEGCALVWESVTGASIGPEVRAALYDATAGNPLALRSALRGALQRKGSDRAAIATSWRTPAGRADLVRTLERSVGLLAEGMTSDLEPALLEAARRVAPLGEVFDHDAALVMLDGDTDALDSLIFNGLVATAVAAPSALPLEPGATPPLAFTHTLLHRELVRTASIDDERLVRVVAIAPLYSLLPFTLLSTRAIDAPDADIATMRRAFNRTLQVEIAVQRTAMWRSASIAWSAAARLLEARIGSWSQPDWEEKIVRLAHHKINLVRRAQPGELAAWLDHLRWLSADASSDELMLGRLHEIANRCLLHGMTDADFVRSMWLEVQSLAAARPHLQDTFPFVECIIALCIAASAGDDDRTLRAIEEQVEELLRVGELSDRIRMAIETKVRPQFLRLFDDDAEVRARLAFVEAIEEQIDRGDLVVWKFCMNFLSDAAFVDRFESSYDMIARTARDQGSLRTAFDLAVRHLQLRAGRGDTIGELNAGLDNAIELLPESHRRSLAAERAPSIIDAMLLGGDAAAARELIERYGVDASRLGPYRGLLLGMDDDGSIDRIPPGTTPVLRLGDVVELHARLEGRARAIVAGTSRRRAAEGDSALEARVSEAIDWLLSPGRAMHAFVSPLLERCRELLTPRKISALERRLSEFDPVSSSRQVDSDVDGPWSITMLGTIGARRGDREPRLQGARARTLLGVMVANEMLDEPLSSAEFARLVAGDETMAIEKARNIQKTTVHRVREALGQDAILTDGIAPRLNPDVTDVDLLRARTQIDAARLALRSTSPMQARAAILAALAIVRGEVAFPSLYDDFMEAMREDFESDIRTTALDVARALMREGGAADAADVLREASITLPGDGEIAETLQSALAALGRRADAVRVERLGVDS